MRKQIELPEAFLFSSEYDVLYSDVNSANHLGADRVLPIAMEAQLRFIKYLGYSNAMVFEDAGLIMAHSEVQYLAEAKHGNRLQVDVAARNFGSKSFELVYSIKNLTQENETARVVTTLLFFDYRAGKVIEVPPMFMQRIEKAQRGAA